MSCGRGRPPKVMPVHPNLVLARSVSTSLSTALYIQRSIKNKYTSHLYESSKQIWQKAKANYYRSKQSGHPDFSHLIEAESNIRKNSLQMLFEIAAAYGNREVYRVKSSDKSVGPLNHRLNVGGAALRNFVMTQFPFPDRELLRGYVGEIYGYPGNSLCHKVVPIHSLPELDFIDSCRKHIQVLNTWCYIFDVSPTDTARYSNLFLLRARPYLEHIYSEHRYGEAGFRENTVKILRELKNDIAKHYRVRTGDVQTVTSALEYDPPDFSLDFFRNQVDEARSRGIVWSSIDELDRILMGGSIVESIQEEKDDGTWEERPAPCLTEKDVEHFWTRLLELSGQRGSQVHRLIASLFPSFWNLERVIRYGDEFEGDDSYIVGSEIPLETDIGRGRADLVLFRREISSDGLDVFWKPVLVVDIKTKLGFFWDLGFEVKKSNARTRHGLALRKVPQFKIEYRSLDEDEWRSIIEANPTPNTIEQVNAYADTISATYHQIAQRSESGPMLKATLLVDAYEDIRKIRSLVRSFLIEVFESVALTQDGLPRTIFKTSVKGDRPRIALILHEQEEYIGYEAESVLAPMKLVQDPFEKTSAEERRFILYLSGTSPTSGGISAAWIAKYYHGLHLLNELAEEIEKPQIFWIDLANEFTQPHLRTARLRLRPYSSNEKDVLRSQPSYIRRLFDSIEIRGMSDEVDDFLFSDGVIPTIRSEGEPKLIIVSGWDVVNDSTPLPFREKLRILHAGLLDQLPKDDDITIIWFDSPVPGQENSSVYSTRTLLPFYQDSPLFEEVTEIVWNLPTAPGCEILAEQWSLPVIGTTPLYDDIRIIILQKRTGFGIELTSVPPLIGWSKKFRSENPEMDLDLLLQEFSPDVNIRSRIKILGLDLVPHLLSLWPQASIEIDGMKKSVLHVFKETRFPNQLSREEITVVYEIHTKEGKGEPSIFRRVRFRPRGPKREKAYVPIAVGTINSHRFYRLPYGLRTEKRSSFETPETTSDAPLPRFAFGRLFMRSDGETQDELLVIEDFHERTRLFVGLFTENSRQDQSGFVWADSDNNRLQQVLNESLDSFTSEDIVVVYREDRQEFWQFNSEDWNPGGFVEMIAEKRGRVCSISAIRIGPLLSVVQPLSIENIPQSFNQRIQPMLEKLVKERESLKQVRVSIHDTKTGCEIRFLDEINDKVVYSIGVAGTSDLVRILRQPISVKRLLRTRKGESVVWNPFTDIDYGSLEAIRPFVETSAPRDVGRTLLPVVAKFTELREERPLRLVLIHDSTICPLVEGSETIHDACWRITSNTEDSIIESYQKPMTGREIYGHFASGKIETRNTTYSIDLSFSHDIGTQEFYVYHEDDWIRRLLREKNIFLKKLMPGTFIRTDESWIVNFTAQDNNIEWIGISTISDLRWKNKTFRFVLNPSLNLKQAQTEFIDRVREEIAIENIQNLQQLKEQIQLVLTKRGYGDERPICHLSITRDGKTFTILLEQVSELGIYVIIRKSFTLKEHVHHESLLGDVYYQLEEGELSHYNITNEKEFLAKFQLLLDEVEVN